MPPERSLPKETIFTSTNAIGDSIMEAATVHALSEYGITVGKVAPAPILSLWKGLPHTQLYTNDSAVPSDVPRVDVRGYQDAFPHSTQDPKSGEFRHLSWWIGRKAGEQLGIDLDVSSEQVILTLTEEEATWGRDEYLRLLKASGNKVGVIITPNATTGNRNITPQTVQKICTQLEEKEITPFLLNPLPEKIYDNVAAARIGNPDLRKAAALLWASDAVICVDSGPLHMVNAALQGSSKELADKLGVNADQQKVVLVTGSSNPEVVGYKGNQSVHGTGGCPLAERGGCGCHGYNQLKKYDKHFGYPFFPAANPNDKGGCIYEHYSRTGISSCMEAISPDEVVEKVITYFRRIGDVSEAKLH